jgi:uncharacterized protein
MSIRTALKQGLDDTVMSCVNAVGVEVNTASAALLTYVSGLGPALAGRIVARRDEHGPFSSREELKQVPRLGAKAFEQAAGFLRIRAGANPSTSAVPPRALWHRGPDGLGPGVTVAGTAGRAGLRTPNRPLPLRVTDDGSVSPP